MTDANTEAAKYRTQRNQALVREAALKALAAKAGITDDQISKSLEAVASFNPANVDHGVLSGADAQSIAGMLPDTQKQDQPSNPMEMFMQMMQSQQQQQPNQQQQRQQAPKPSMMEQMMPVFMMSMMNNMMQNQNKVANLPETPSGGKEAAGGGLTPENVGKMSNDQINANWDNIVTALEGQAPSTVN